MKDSLNVGYWMLVCRELCLHQSAFVRGTVNRFYFHSTP